MDPAESRLLASHMGHDYNIHLRHYAMQTDILERSRVAKVLSAISIRAISRPDKEISIHDITFKD